MANQKAPVKASKTADKTSKPIIKAKPIDQGKKPAPGAAPAQVTQTVPDKAVEKGAAPATA